MSLIDLIKNFNFQGSANPDIKYLSSPEIGDIVINGLTETYLTQPINPIRYLGNWLLNQHKSKELVKKYEIIDENRKKYKEKFEKEIKDKEEEKEKIKIEKEKIESKRIELIEYISKSSDIEEELDYICNELAVNTNSTGVYLYNFGLKIKKVDILDDDKAHEIEPYVYRIVNTSSDHQVLKDKFLLQEEGIINKIYTQSEEKEVVQSQNEDGENEKKEINEEDNIPNHILIDEVVRDNQIKFFFEPRLGCYFAIDASYNSSINEESLSNAIVCLKEYKDEEKLLEEEKKVQIEQIKEQMQVKENLNKNNEVENEEKVEENKENEYELLIKQLENKKVELKDFSRKNIRLVFGMDTLGQDRIYSDEEKKYIFKIIKEIIKVRTNQEKERLLKMRDLRILSLEMEKEYLDLNPIDKIIEAEEIEFKKYLTEKFESGIDDDQKEDEQSKFKLKFICQIQLIDNENLNKLFNHFSQYEFVEYPRIFQYILYFNNYKGEDINYPNTNKLNWKVARKYWNVSLIKYIQSYKYQGPITTNIGSLLKISNLLKVLNEFDEEKIREYSFVLSRIYDAFRYLILLRKKDIEKRRKKIKEFNIEVDIKIKEKEQREALLVEDLKVEKEKAEEEGIEFNEDEFYIKFNEKNPHIEINKKMEYDIDNDYDLIDDEGNEN